MGMKKALIVALVCVNLALVAALVFGTHAPRAGAQTLRGGNDYLLYTGRIGNDWDAVYMVDLKTRRLAAWKFDKTQKRLVQMRGRQLVDDFKR